MKKQLATLALATGLAFVGAAGASAAYPPGGPGTITSTKTCDYVEESAGKLSAWSITVNYEVTAADTTLTIVSENPAAKIVRPVPIGVGSVTVKSTDPGETASSGYVPHSATLSAGGQTVTASVGGCPIPSAAPSDSVADITFKTPGCVYSQNRSEVESWGVDVDLNVKTENAKLSILGPNGVVYRAAANVARGQQTLILGSNEPGLNEVAGTKELTVRVQAGDLVASKSLTPCPVSNSGTTTTTDPTVNGVSIDQSDCEVDTTKPDPVIKDWHFVVNYRVVSGTGTLTIDDQRGTTYLDRKVTGNGSIRIDSSVGSFGTVQAAFIDFRVTLLVNDVVYQADVTPCVIITGNPTTTTTTKPQINPALPATGANTGLLVAAAVALLAAGLVLMWSARQRRQTS